MRHPLIFLALIFLGISCHQQNESLRIETRSVALAIDALGQLTEFTDKAHHQNYIAPNTSAALLSVGIGSHIYPPVLALFDTVDRHIKLVYPRHDTLTLTYKSSASHFTFELVSVSAASDIEYIVWGPYPTSLKDTIGETIGVVRGKNFVMGLQSLNPKTLGGYPWNDNDCMPQLDIFDQDDLTDFSEEGKRYVLYRVEAALPTQYGSSLQAYCRNRSNKRIIKNWGHSAYLAPPFSDGGIIGSKIALFGSPSAQALDYIERIEIEETLPHPMIDGVWGKRSQTATAAYLIMDFGSADIDQAIAITKKAGLRYLYHPEPFENWGHFTLKRNDFPDGYADMKACVDKASEQGIMLGVHTLSNFISTNDPYVSPVPDERLAMVGTTELTEALTKNQTEISIGEPEFFGASDNDHLKTVRIASELIRYASVSETAPWILMDCQRGAFNTKATSHPKGDTISKLADHGYMVFLGNAALSIEMAENIARLFNETGLRQISFDGLEGNRSTAMGNYGEILFTNSWYKHLNRNIKQHYIADASRTCHYFWHIYTRMNWGEPWYAGFRESQTAYRLKNQEYFKRNYMPGMLGWFSMKPETSIEDIEWMLARSAAYDAGYGFSTNKQALSQNGNTDQILRLLGEWEQLRLSGVLTETQKKEMQDTESEFSLTVIDDSSWYLTEIFAFRYKHLRKEKQAGEPTFSSFEFNNPSGEQPLQFMITAYGGRLSNLKLGLDHHSPSLTGITLKDGECLKYTGDGSAIIYNASWHELARISVDESSLLCGNGRHTLYFDCTTPAEGSAGIELRLAGAAEYISPIR